MVSFNLKVLAKFGLCSNCSQKLDACSLACACKNFATACQMLVLAKINTLLACSQKPFYTPLSRAWGLMAALLGWLGFASHQCGLHLGAPCQ